MSDLLSLVIVTSPASWLLLVATMAALIAIPRLFGMHYFTGLAYAQMTLTFNAVTIVAGLENDAVTPARAVHFYVVEFAFLVLVFAAYRHLLLHRSRVLAALQAFFAGRGAAVLVGLMALLAAFNVIIVPTNGESRIAYMTSSWFSLLKPMIQLATPLAYIGVPIMLLDRSRRGLGFTLLVITIASNIFSGSKASFLFFLLTAFLVLRDLMGESFRVARADRWRLALIVVPLTALTLTRLDVSPADVSDRFLLFGESTILTYYSDTPTEACEGVSTLASMHRGIARALGDPSANDIDTLFGFALSKLQTGENTLTGPNGRLGSYFICNFPGEKIALGCIMVTIYFALLLKLHARSLRRPALLPVVFPYIVTSLGLASQDYNLLMADITLATLLLFITLPLFPAQRTVPFG